jgi:integrase
LASVKKRAGSAQPWQVRWRDHNGKAKSQQFTLKADATNFAAEVERAKQTGRLDLLDAGTQTLAEVGAEFFRLHKSEWAQATARNLAYIWNACVEGDPGSRASKAYPRAAIADLQVRSIRKSHVQGFKVDAQDAGVPDGSIRKALGLISRVLDHAADDGLIAANPAAGVKRPSGTREGDVPVITPAGVEAIRAELSERDAALVSILAYAGLRPQELRALEPRHIGPRALRVEFACNPDGSVRRLKGRTGGGRSVPLCAALASDLAAVKWGPGYLFKRSGGGAWTKTDWDNWRKRKFLPAVARAGVKIEKPYALRHSIASLWLRQGTDRVTVADWLGHSVTVLEREYAHVIAELDPSDRRSVDALIAEARSVRKAA